MIGSLSISREARRLVIASFIALSLTLLAACGGRDKSSGLVNEVTAAEVPSPTVAVATSAPSTPSVSPTVTYSEAEAVYNSRRYGEAMEMFAVISLRNPQNAWGHYMHGLSAWKAGELVRAESAFTNALNSDSGHVKTRINLARVLLDGGRAEEALPHAERAVVLDSGNADGYRVLGRTQAMLKDVEPAIVSYRKAISLDSKDSWSLNNLGYVLIQSDRFDDAIGPLARAAELSPGSAVIHNNLGMALERTWRFTQAAESYRNAVAADSGYAKAVSSLERIKDRKDYPDVSPVDLKVLAETFVTGVRGG